MRICNHIHAALLFSISVATFLSPFVFTIAWHQWFSRDPASKQFKINGKDEQVHAIIAHSKSMQTLLKGSTIITRPVLVHIAIRFTVLLTSLSKQAFDFLNSILNIAEKILQSQFNYSLPYTNRKHKHRINWMHRRNSWKPNCHRTTDSQYM